MVGRLIQITPSAYQYPLIFKQLWHTPRVQAPDQEVVYRDLKRFTYLQIKERIGRLASALSKAGVEPGGRNSAGRSAASSWCRICWFGCSATSHRRRP
jgi:acyl-CoA synthetase (AMP-forming)/AMP-acid ligase II